MDCEINKIREVIVSDKGKGLRIDKYLVLMEEGLSRSFIQTLIDDNKITVNGKSVKSGYKLRINDLILIEIPKAKELDVLPENIPLDILYEDEDLIVINKEKGMVVHPSQGHMTGTLVNALMYHCKENLSGLNGVLRPGIVHRIDMDTTGAIVVCKNDFSHNHISEQLKVHSITRKYHAIVHGHLKEDSGIVDAPIGRHPNDRKKMAINYKNGKQAVTHYNLMENFTKPYSYIECKLETGRTHQIRVHMSSIHHPLLGDDVYCKIKSPFFTKGQSLHASILGFIHPRTNKYMEFEASKPEYFEEILKKLRNMV